MRNIIINFQEKDAAYQADDSDPQLDQLKTMARTEFVNEIIPATDQFIADNQKNKNPARAAIARRLQGQAHG